MDNRLPDGARLIVTPHGQLRFVAEAPVPLGPGLLRLGAQLGRELAPDLAFGREIAKAFLSAICQVPSLEAVREGFSVDADAAALSDLSLPVSLEGRAHLSRETLLRAWAAMEAAARDEIAARPGRVAEYLGEKSPEWNEIGKLTVCVAHPDDGRGSFELVATLVRAIGSRGRAVPEPLAIALPAAASAFREAIRDRLRRGGALAPVLERLAHDPAAHVACEVEDARRLFEGAAALAELGITVMVPDWWRTRRVVAPELELEIGAKPSIGTHGVLDFRACATIDGEPLDREELEEIARSATPLRLVRGRWVEIDRRRAADIVAELQRLEGHDGIDAAEAVRLLGRADLDPIAPDEMPERPARTIVRPGPWLASLHEELRAPRRGGPSDPGGLFRGALRPYQRRGVAWLRLLGALGVGGCLADDMGLGKTPQVLAELANRARARRESGGPPDLVVVPASLLGNWLAEAERFTPELRTMAIHPAHDRAAVVGRPRSFASTDFAITTYGMLLRSKWLAREGWGLVVLDEAQAIKNGATKQACLAKSLRAEARLALTGTPVENRLGDLLSILDFLNPGMLGDEDELRELESRVAESPARLERLRASISPYVLRRTKDDPRVAPDLPAKIERTLECGLTRRQAGLYELEVQRLARALERAKPARRRILVATALMRLKQICNHPDHYFGRSEWRPSESAKLRALVGLAQRARDRGEPMLVFTQFARATDPLAEALTRAFGAPGIVLRGDTPVARRPALVEKLQRGDAPFMVISIRAGGVGLNLTAAREVVLFDRWWNPAVERQAIDRAHRIGQTRDVRVHKLVCRGTIEEKIDAMLREKSALADAIVGGNDAAALAALDRDELVRVLSLDTRVALAA